MIGTTPLAYRIVFVLLVCGVVVWTFRRISSVESFRSETSRRFGISLSRRSALAWLSLSSAVALGLLAFLAFYFAGRVG